MSDLTLSKIDNSLVAANTGKVNPEDIERLARRAGIKLDPQSVAARAELGEAVLSGFRGFIAFDCLQSREAMSLAVEKLSDMLKSPETSEPKEIRSVIRALNETVVAQAALNTISLKVAESAGVTRKTEEKERRKLPQVDADVAYVQINNTINQEPEKK